MKYIALLLLTVFLVSCGTTEENKVVDVDHQIDEMTEKTTENLNNALDSIPSTTDDLVSDIVKIDAKYNNPKVEVDMEVSYKLDTDGKITMINVSATTYDLTDFNTAAQVVIGKTLEEASETAIAGGSLTTHAFQDALESHE